MPREWWVKQGVFPGSGCEAVARGTLTRPEASPLAWGGAVGQQGPQKDSWEGGNGVAAQSISPRPLARAREICVPTFSDRDAVSAPARIPGELKIS